MAIFVGYLCEFSEGVVIVQLPGSFGETLLVTHCASVPKTDLETFPNQFGET